MTHFHNNKAMYIFFIALRDKAHLSNVNKNVCEVGERLTSRCKMIRFLTRKRHDIQF